MEMRLYADSEGVGHDKSFASCASEIGDGCAMRCCAGYQNCTTTVRRSWGCFLLSRFVRCQSTVRRGFQQ